MSLPSRKDGGRQVWLHNELTSKALSLLAGTCLGQGGLGSFVSLVNGPVEEQKAKFAWRYTRYTNHKRDVAEHANGSMVFNKAGVALGGKPSLSCLHDIEQELGNNVTCMDIR